MMMDPVTKMYIYITVAIVMIVFTVYKVRRSSLDRNAKLLLIVMAFFMPIIALIMFFILDGGKKNMA
jgi:hypothetical protein